MFEMGTKKSAKINTQIYQIIIFFYGVSQMCLTAWDLVTCHLIWYGNYKLRQEVEVAKKY